jgi:hypothetical protein
MFSLEKQNAKLTAVNPRAEIHGEERKPAVDLKFEIKTSNDILSEFDPSLKHSLYRKPDANDTQQQLIDEPGHFPVFRFPLMGTIKWGKEFAGYDTRIHWGVSGKDDIILGDCQVDGFRFECQDGGTVVTGFRVIAHADEHAMGKLCGLVQQDVEMSLIPPEEDAE